MTLFVMVLHFIVCILMILVVLLQPGKGTDISAMMGGGSQTVFGPRGAATFLSKATIVIAVVFMLTSLYLAGGYKTQAGTTVIDGQIQVPQPETQVSESQPESNTAETRFTETSQSVEISPNKNKAQPETQKHQ